MSAVTAPSVAALLSPLIPSLLLLADKFQESSSEGLNAACVDAHKGDAGGAWKCIFAQWSSAHIKTPTFPMQSQYDAWQTGNVMGAPDPGTTPAATQNVFGKNLTALVKSQLLCAPHLCPRPLLDCAHPGLNAAVVFARRSQPQHGIFLDSCHHHCGNWDGSEIDGKLIGSALQEWYNMGSQKLPNKGFFNQDKPFPCDACCKPGKYSYGLIGIGRPFMSAMAAKEDEHPTAEFAKEEEYPTAEFAVLAHAVEMLSDWNAEL